MSLGCFDQERRLAIIAGVDLDEVEVVATSEEVDVVVVPGMKDRQTLYDQAWMLRADLVENEVEWPTGSVGRDPRSASLGWSAHVPSMLDRGVVCQRRPRGSRPFRGATWPSMAR
jgi:hypothetical protein